MPIVMVHEVGNNALEMRLIQDEQPVETLVPDGSYESLRDPIRLWRAKRRAHDLNLFCPKHFIESCCELPISVPNQEPEGFWAIAKSPRHLPRLLCNPEGCN